LIPIHIVAIVLPCPHQLGSWVSPGLLSGGGGVSVRRAGALGNDLNGDVPFCQLRPKFAREKLEVILRIDSSRETHTFSDGEWVMSDSTPDYLSEIEQEGIEQLQEILQGLGFSSEVISEHLQRSTL
jgi:hypothetical protein